jgi:uncharacterized RDD family membrane protein YckC
VDLSVATPERVAMSLPVAGLGYRAMAYLVDLGLIFSALLLAYFAYSLVGPSVIEVWPGLSSAVRVGFAIGLFIAQWGYWALFEALWNGQTPGKRLLKIRVVKRDGSPVGPLESAVRNLVRVADFFPAGYALGITVMLIDAQQRRLGDLAAGTLMVREEAISLQRYEAPEGSRPSGGAHGTAELELLAGFLARYDTLEPAARLTLGRNLLKRLGSTAEPADDAQLKAALAALRGG